MTDQTGRPSGIPLGWLLTGVGGLLSAAIVYAASQVVQVPQTTAAIHDIAVSMDRLRSDITAAQTTTSQRIEAISLASGRAEIASQGVQEQIAALRSRQERLDQFDRELDVRLSKSTMELAGDVKNGRLQGEAVERELAAKMSALQGQMEANAARSKEVDDRMIASMHQLSDRVDQLTRGASRGAFEPEESGKGNPIQRPAFERPLHADGDRDLAARCVPRSWRLAVFRAGMCP